KNPDPRSIAIARKYRIDISQQRCRKFSAEDFKEFDLIYAMDKENYANIISLAKKEEDIKKVQLLLEGVATPYTEVPDPYYGGEQGFQEVYDLVETACNHIVSTVVTSSTSHNE
ncbi:MAG: low molecular weight phosphotyrosine protein phosphatase, partial [Eudoraea sp.]|nr:low molecular weight phosphotyrosine protein phosphatase [Eudoraea sp.]